MSDHFELSDRFNPQELSHVSHQRVNGNAAESVLTAEDFARAITEITSWTGYEPTPLHDLKTLANRLGLKQLCYKDEAPRFGLGSFKALGGAYAALSLLGRELSKRLGREIALKDIRAGLYAKEIANITLASATDGNHGRSLAWGCQQFGAPCRIYIHAEVSKARADAMADLGATIIRIDGNYDESVHLARQEAEENGWFIVSDTSWEGYTQPPKDVMAGYSVMSSEACAQMSEPPTHVFLQGGVGGLAASVAAYLRQYWKDRSPRVVIVEPVLAACLFESAKAGEATSFSIKEETIMAGLSCGEPSPLGWAILQEEASDFLILPDTIVGPTIQLLARPLGDDPVIEAGESAVAGLSAVLMACNSQKMRDDLRLNEDARVLFIGSEGITDRVSYDRLMAEKLDA